MVVVSVLIPTYNCATLLERAIRSVAAQTVAATATIEVVVVDDGSIDDTAERVRDLQRSLPIEIRYAIQDNAGPAAARNRALGLAAGDLVAFLDADDSWVPTKLEAQLSMFDRADVGLVYCDVAFVDASGNAIHNYKRKSRIVDGDIVLPLFRDFFLLTSAVVMRRRLAEQEHGFRSDLPVGEDYDFFLRVLRHCKAGAVAEKLLLRTVRPDSLSRQDFALDARVDLETLRRFVRETPDFAAAYPREIAERIATYHADFAYSLLAHGRRRDALAQSLASLRTSRNLPALKTLVRAFLPQ